MADVTCPFTSPACLGWRPNSGDFRSGREGSGLHVPTLLARAPERCERALASGRQARGRFPSLRLTSPATYGAYFAPQWYMDWSAHPSPTAQWAADLPVLVSISGTNTSTGQPLSILSLNRQQGAGVGAGEQYEAR